MPTTTDDGRSSYIRFSGEDCVYRRLRCGERRRPFDEKQRTSRGRHFILPTEHYHVEKLMTVWPTQQWYFPFRTRSYYVRRLRSLFLNKSSIVVYRLICLESAAATITQAGPLAIRCATLPVYLIIEMVMTPRSRLRQDKHNISRYMLILSLYNSQLGSVCVQFVTTVR
jgi:hypothetical protein